MTTEPKKGAKAFLKAFVICHSFSFIETVVVGSAGLYQLEAL
jgi:hypothetical protein